MSIVITWERAKMSHLLKADPFGEEVFVQNFGKPEPIMNKRIFFNKIYAHNPKMEIVIRNGSQKQEKKMSITEWLRNISRTDNSLVIFIEGYAGCGKSTFVQYILKTQLDTVDYDYSYYNYDIGAYYDNRKSHRIVYAIRECFLAQIEKIVLGHEDEIIEQFKFLLSQRAIEHLDSSKEIFYDFSNTVVFEDAINQLKQDGNDGLFRATLHKQINNFSCEQILSLDFILRIAQYLVRKDRSLIYLCYDNMDSIENFYDLNIFDNTLISMRHNIDNYINDTLRNYKDIPVPRFIIIATYRKITAARVELAIHSERHEDFSEDNQFVFRIDASHLYNYYQIVEKRKRYFDKYFEEENIDVKELRSELEKAVSLFGMTFVENRYAGLWNNNYRSCSDILQVLFDECETDILGCLELLNNKIDGYDESLLSYYGASALFLRAICAVFSDRGIWGEEHLNLIPLDEKKDKYKPYELTSLSRLILTYIGNAKDKKNRARAVSVKELFEEFEDIYGGNEICNSLTNMLNRDKTGTWRRPIYYYRFAINDDQEVQHCLKKQWEKYQSGDADAEYTELLLCECGYAFINRVVSEFEFFSVRIGNEKSLYLVDNAGEMEKIMKSILDAVELCCRRMKIFRENYKKKKLIKTDDMYNQLPIHPRTNNGKSQLHSERIIFSHISYLNHCRLYHMKKTELLDEKVELNKLFIRYIKMYMDLYYAYIYPIDTKRSKPMSSLKVKAQISEKCTIDTDVLYTSIEVESELSEIALTQFL